MEKQEKLKIGNALIIPLLFVATIGFIHFVSYALDVSFVRFGVLPRQFSGLIGILCSPLIHANFGHLFNNSVPLLILGSALFYFYKEIALKVSVWIYLMVGIWTWVSAREAYHIGASGFLYGLFSFLLVSGFIRRNKQLIALSFVVIFIYGSLVWGIFPVDLTVSFEGHFWGFVAGVILAIYYRNQGPQKIEFEWEEEEEDENETDLPWSDEQEIQQGFRYEFKPKNNKN